MISISAVDYVREQCN